MVSSTMKTKDQSANVLISTSFKTCFLSFNENVSHETKEKQNIPIYQNTEIDNYSHQRCFAESGI